MGGPAPGNPLSSESSPRWNAPLARTSYFSLAGHPCEEWVPVCEEMGSECLCLLGLRRNHLVYPQLRGLEGGETGFLDKLWAEEF